jgi:prepilin peptidase CpaA
MIKYAVVLIIVLIAVILDVRSRKIPNVLTFPAMAAGLMIQALNGGGHAFLSGICGMVLGMGLFFIIYLMGVMGAGDAKLIGAIGAFVGPKGVLTVSIFTALAGGIYALLLLLFYRCETKGTLKNIKNTFLIFAMTKKLELGTEKEQQGKPKLCYGIAIAVGTVAYVVMEMTGYKMF